MSLPVPLKFITPKLVVKNILTNKEVTVLGKYNLAPGSTVDLFKATAPGSLTEDQIIRSLFVPDGDMYVEIVEKGSLQILEVDLPSFYFSRVFTENLVAENQSTAGAFPVATSSGEFRWYTFASPIVLSGNQAIIPPASSTQDGYLTKEDYALFASAAVGGNFVIWQYQDFTAPVSAGLTLTDFHNGTGVAFNAAWIVNGTASATLVSNTEQPPTTTLSIPGKWLASNRVEVVSHIGTTVVLNQAPESSLSVRVFYQVAIPAGVATPAGYEEDPNFINERELNFFDDFYVNQNGDETIYGTKTFADSVVISGTITIPTGATDGYFLKSDGTGVGTWGAITSPNGIPAGGTTGQALVKTSNADFDADWEDQTGAGVGLDLNALDVILDGYAESEHAHDLHDVSGLPGLLDGYATDLYSHTGDASIHFTAGSLGLDGYALASHNHGLGEIDNLDLTLDGYATVVDLSNHTGDASIHFTADSLGLDGYFHLSSDNIVTGVTSFSPATSTDSSYILTPSAGVPTTNVVGGSVTNVGGIQYIYDATRSKFLSTERKLLSSGSNANNVTNAYMNIIGSIVSSSTGYRMLRNATITAIWAQTTDVESWTLEVRRNGVTSPILSLVVVAARGDSSVLSNVDVQAGDEIQFYANGTGVRRPAAGIEFAWRI